MRYKYTDTEKRFDGKDVYKTTIYPNISESETDVYITVSDNQFLDGIARKYYGNESYWWVIAIANNIIGGRLSVPIGKQLRIPGNLQKILQDLENLN